MILFQRLYLEPYVGTFSLNTSFYVTIFNHDLPISNHLLINLFHFYTKKEFLLISAIWILERKQTSTKLSAWELENVANLITLRHDLLLRHAHHKYEKSTHKGGKMKKKYKSLTSLVPFGGGRWHSSRGRFHDNKSI